MRTITDIYSHLEDRELNVECPSREEGMTEPGEKERILQRTLEKIEVERNEANGRSRHVRRLNSKKKIGLLALAAVLLMGITVSAAEYFHLNQNLLNFLGVTSPEEAEGLESMSADLTQKEHAGWKTEAENHGVKIRAGQTVSDGETVYIYFDVELPDGIFAESDDKMDRIVRFRENLFSIGGLEDQGAGEMVIQKKEETPDQYYAVAEIGTDVLDANGQSRELTMTFRNLGLLSADETSTNWTELVPGEWTLKWELEYEDVSRTYMVSKTLPLESGAIRIQSIRLSPFGIVLTGTADGGDKAADDLSGMDGVLTADGFREDFFKVQSIDSADGKFTLKGTFRTVTDMDKVVGVRIHGEDILFKE